MLRTSRCSLAVARASYIRVFDDARALARAAASARVAALTRVAVPARAAALTRVAALTIVAVAAAAFASTRASAQNLHARAVQPSVRAQPDRVRAQVDSASTEGPSAFLPGHLPAFIQPANDAGAVPEASPLKLEFVLTRALAQQAAFEQLIQDQQNPASPSYHHWLTPQQVGSLYGPTAHDLAAFSSWLSQQGIEVDAISPSGLFIQASGPASTIARALGTSFRLYRLPGEAIPAGLPSAPPHLSAASNPSLPAAFVPLVAAISGLTSLPIQPQHTVEVGSFEAPAGSGSAFGPHPRLTSSSGNHYISPGDFATLYDLAPVYAAGINGSGQRLAILGRSRVNPSDLANFSALSYLPSVTPNVLIPPSGVDPGVTGNADQSEATLDLERTIATAPGLIPDLVVSLSEAGTDGIRIAAQYNVNTLLDPIETISFGTCEDTAANVSYWTTLFAQAAAEGIATFVSAGDAGVSCGTAFSAPAPVQTAGINALCASPNVTCVGGTEFNDNASPSTYWESSNSPALASVLGLIPEGAWNEPSSTATNGTTSSQIASGGGGASRFVAKPSYQTGTGVPADGVRDVPDVSFSSSRHDAYFGCFAGLAGGGGSCVPSASGSFSFAAFSGTSAAAPSMAAIAALLNQKFGGPQGPINPLLYRLAQDPRNAVFNDATIVSSGVSNCTSALPSLCNNSTPGPQTQAGGLPGFVLTEGYDQATGLGSVDAAHLLTSALSGALSTHASLTLSSPPYTTRLPITLTASLSPDEGKTPTGSISFTANGTSLGLPLASLPAPGLPSYPLSSAGSASASVSLPAGTYTFAAVYPGDAAFLPETSTPQTVTVDASGTIATAISLTPSKASLTTAQTVTLTAAILPSTPAGALTGSVQFLLGQSPIALAPVLQGQAMTSPLTLPIGSSSLTARYLGDSTYAPATSAPAVVSVIGLTPSLVVSLNPAIAFTSTSANPVYSNITVSAAGPRGAPVPSGNFILTASSGSGTPPQTIGTFTLNAGLATIGLSSSTSGSTSIVAQYLGDTLYQPSSSPPARLTFVDPFTLAPASSTLIVANGGDSLNRVAITAKAGYTGTVTLSCTAALSSGTPLAAGSGTPLAAGSCTLAPASIPLGPPASTTVSITTSKPRPTCTAGLIPPARQPLPSPGIGGIAISALLLCLLPFRRCRALRLRLSLWKAFSLLLLLNATLASLSGCGSGLSVPIPPPACNNPATPATVPGLYTVTVTATGSNASGSTPTILTSYTLTVQ